MNKIIFAFLKSHLRRAIYELEVANKMKEDCVDVELINEIKAILLLLQNEHDEESE